MEGYNGHYRAAICGAIARFALQFSLFLVVVVLAATTDVSGADSARSPARVVKLVHLAIILPESETTRDDWNCDLWTPTVKEVAGAEKAILHRIRELAKDGVDVEADGKHVIQYYGVVLEKKKWIACSVVNIKAFLNEAKSGDPEGGLESNVRDPFYRSVPGD